MAENRMLTEKQANLFRNKDANVFCEPEEYYGLDLPF